MVDIAPRSYGEKNHRSLVDALIALDLSTCRRQQDVHKALEPAIPSIEERSFLITNLVRDKNRNFTWRINLKTIGASFKKVMKGISPARIFKKPTLFLRGEYSDYMTSADLAIIKRIFPLSTVMTVKGTGHSIHIDAAETFVHIVNEFSRANKAG